MVCSDKRVKVIATWLPDLELVLELKGSQGIRKLTGQNGDADGHSLHLGPWPKVNNVQGAIWLRLGKGRGVQKSTGGVVGEGKSCNEYKHMEKQIFSLPAAIGEGKCQHAPRPRLTVLHSAPPPGPPCSATEYGQQWHCGASPQGRGKHHSAPDHPHACMYTNTSCTPCSFSHKRHTHTQKKYCAF